MQDFTDRLSDWLIARAIRDADLSETLSQFANRLVDGGLPIARIVIGRGLAHPVVGLASLIWERDTGGVSIEVTPPGRLTVEDVRKTPFGAMSLTGETLIRADLRDPEERARFSLFDKLAAEGTTGYVAFARSFRAPDEPVPASPDKFKGMVVSFTTRRFTGFSDADVETLQRLLTPLCICVRIATDRLFVTELLDLYLGRISGRRVLTGQTRRGDGQTIECALFYSDMRGSVGMAQAMDASAYLATVNEFFDCTAQAVLGHGGEVLKFIGDGILAIFPFDDDTRLPANMCRAALDAAREAFARADHANVTRAANSLPPIDFGLALHAGEVIYGNVGTDKRLDFTATGPAVGLVSRCEGLTRGLDARIISTSEFAALCPATATDLGAHALRGFGDAVPLFTYPHAAP